MEGPSIKDQMADSTPAALAIAQMLKFNSMKYNRTRGTTASVTVRHTSAKEMLVPTFTGNMAELPAKHPDVVRKCRTGSFTVQKMKKV